MKQKEVNPKINNSNDDILVEYIYLHPNSTFTELNQQLTYENEESKKGYMSRKTLKIRLDNLIKWRHIIPHGKRNTNAGERDDIFTFNEEKLDLYPHLKLHKEKQVKAKLYECEEQIKEFEYKEKKYQYQRVLLDLIQIHTELHLTKFADTEEIYFSNLQICKLKQLIDSLLYDTFLNNKELWFRYNNPEALDFDITIKANWSKAPLFFEVFEKLRDLELEEKQLFSIPNKHSQIYYKEGQNKLEHTDIRSYYTNAMYEHQSREKNMNFQKEEKRLQEFKETGKIKKIEEEFKKKIQPKKKELQTLKKQEKKLK
jgi:hypothetical protein